MASLHRVGQGMVVAPTTAMPACFGLIGQGGHGANRSWPGCSPDLLSATSFSVETTLHYRLVEVKRGLESS
jgi:hypothetical protein